MRKLMAILALVGASAIPMFASAQVYVVQQQPRMNAGQAFAYGFAATAGPLLAVGVACATVLPCRAQYPGQYAYGQPMMYSGYPQQRQVAVVFQPPPPPQQVLVVHAVPNLAPQVNVPIGAPGTITPGFTVAQGPPQVAPASAPTAPEWNLVKTNGQCQEGSKPQIAPRTDPRCKVLPNGNTWCPGECVKK